MATDSSHLSEFLQPTWYLDSDSPVVAEYAAKAVEGAATDPERAQRLYYAVRDGIRYNPYAASLERSDYKASAIARMDAGFCIQKAILLSACARALGIPSQVGFADVRNHLASEKLLEVMGTDLFVFHGFSELYLEGRWVKVTPTFNRSLCERFGVLPLEFDGESDALFHPFDREGRRHMEYVRQRGSFADFPYEDMVRVLSATYTRMFEAAGRRGEDPAFDAAD